MVRLLLVDDGAISPRVADEYARSVLRHSPQASDQMLPGVQATAADGVPTVSSPEEAMRLPSGTRFKTPDGRMKVRP